MFQLIKESENHFVVPLAPLNAIYSLYKALRILITRLFMDPKNGKVDEKNDKASSIIVQFQFIMILINKIFRQR